MVVRILFMYLFFISIVNSQILEEIYRFGSTGDKPGQFRDPQALAVAAGGTVYIVDTGNNRIQLFNHKGKFLKSTGGFGFKKDQFDQPMDIWVRSVIDYYISDYNNQRIQRFDRNMNFISVLSRNDVDDDEFNFYEVSSVALNGQKELFLIDHDENKVVKLDRNGDPERIFGTLESGEGELKSPHQIDILKDGRLIISDISRQSLLIYDAFGSFIMEVYDSQMQTPKGIGVSPEGEVFVADPGAGEVFMIDSNFKKVKRLKIRGGESLNQPKDVAFFKDSKGKINMFILDNDQVIIGLLIEKQE